MFSFTKPIHEIGFTFDLFIGTCLVPLLLVAVSDPDVLDSNGKVDLKKGRGKATACGRDAAPGGSTFLPQCP